MLNYAKYILNYSKSNIIHNIIDYIYFKKKINFNFFNQF
jgi:hypothetical protein